MHNSEVSIVLPTYNGERFLRACVESCLAQTYSRWELIIVDDGSTDSTPDVVAELSAADPRIRSFRHETNRRLPAALNTGFALARGEYLTWTSDDNLYRAHALEQMARFLDRRPDADFVYADYTAIDSEGTVLHSKTSGPAERLVFGNVVGPCFLYRRAVYERIGDFADDLYLAEDYDYWLRVSGHFRLVPLHEDLYLYRQHGESLTSRCTAEVGRATERCLERNLPNLAWAGRRQLQRRYLRLACEAKARHDAEVCRKWLRRAVRIAPWSFLNSLSRVLYLAAPTSLPRAVQSVFSRRGRDRKAA
jgi:glycosyltransferase involved in cell wall biosynthesis